MMKSYALKFSFFLQCKFVNRTCLAPKIIWMKL